MSEFNKIEKKYKDKVDDRLKELEEIELLYEKIQNLEESRENLHKTIAVYSKDIVKRQEIEKNLREIIEKLEQQLKEANEVINDFTEYRYLNDIEIDLATYKYLEKYKGKV